MRLDEIVLKLRTADTHFDNNIGGSAELNAAIQHTLTTDMAFVVPVADFAEKNQYDSTVMQMVTERFGVIVALGADASQKEQLGFAAYSQLHDIRNQIFKALLGWQPDFSETYISYSGGRLVDLNNGYLWWQFEFEFKVRIRTLETFDDGSVTIGIGEDTITTDPPEKFNTIYANYIQAPSADLPHTGDLPLADGYPDVALPDMAQWLDFDKLNPDAGAFGKGFTTQFDTYTE